MKEVGEKKAVNEILNDAKNQGFSIDTTDYSNGFEYITFTKTHKDNILIVGYDTFTGQFGGNYGDIFFDDTTPSVQDEPRMKELFDLFYLPQTKQYLVESIEKATE